MELSGSQIETLRDALLSAFPKQGDLAQMVRFHLDENLDAVAEGKNQTDRIYKFIEWAEAQGRLPNLIMGAATSNPGNPKLQRWIKENVADSLDEIKACVKDTPKNSWFLDSFGLAFAQWLNEDDRTQFQSSWDKTIDWAEKEKAYRESLLRIYGKLRIFGKPREVTLTDVFADVYILDKLTARRRHSIDQLMAHGDLRDFGDHHRNERTNGVSLVTRGENLYILGKPGAGKTTFLKYLTVQAATDKLPRIPIFVSLNDWANSPYGKLGQETLLPYIAEEFAICHFPDAEPFIEYLLKETDQAMVLFDGLDEIKQENEQRLALTRMLQNFARQYDRCQCLITCRIAANEYAFEGFQDVEIADFTYEQVNQYAQKWFGEQEEKLELFQRELDKENNKGLAELCNSPLLLSMLCLYFDDAMEFPTRRAELYEEAIDALLRKWDSSRQIQRDKIYQELSPRRKQQMFAAIAAQTFNNNQQFFEERKLEAMIVHYLARLPNAPPSADIDGHAVLKAIEAYHSIFVERARGIYSFSHLTFQEYFTARYIVENEARGTIRNLVNNYLTDRRWRETFLLTVSLLDNADSFAAEMDDKINSLMGYEPELADLIAWVDIMASQVNCAEESQRAEILLAYIVLDLALALARTLALALDLALDRALDLARTLAGAHARTNVLVPALAHSRTLAISRTLDLSLEQDLELACKRSRDLDQMYGSIVGLDYRLLYAWQMAQNFAETRDFSKGQSYTAQYKEYFAGVIELSCKAGLSSLTDALTTLLIPDASESQGAWQNFGGRLQVLLMKKRNFNFERKFTSERSYELIRYFSANELLVQCLNLAVVSDRDAVMAGLLKPPEGNKSTNGRTRG